MVVFSTLVGKSIPAFYKQYRLANLRNPIVRPITSEVEFHSMGVESAAGHYFADGRLVPPSQAVRDPFALEYQRCYGEKPINGMMESVYDAIQMLGQCYGEARCDTATWPPTRETVSCLLKELVHDTPTGRVVIDSRTQHAWLWARIARIAPEGGVDEIWKSPGPMPPRPFGERTDHGGLPTPLPLDLRPIDPFNELAGSSGMLSECVQVARVAAGTACPVLLVGETGTGKELFAKAIHRASGRGKGPFVPINCAAIPRDLIATELFGYEGGAFTGAAKDGKKGKFELASGGTLFLDEIGQMSHEVQVILLRVLQENEVFRVGGGRKIDVDVRIIAATNAEISPEAQPSNGFRSDLYYRLNVFRIDLPALRFRREDIKDISEAILARLNQAENSHKILSDEAMATMLRYHWPGNVRELENSIKRAFYMAGDERILGLSHSPKCIAETLASSSGSKAVDPSGTPTRDSCWGNRVAGNDGVVSLQSTEKAAIARAIAVSGHNMSRASRMLGISRSTLYRKVDTLSIAVTDDFPFISAGR